PKRVPRRRDPERSLFSFAPVRTREEPETLAKDYPFELMVTSSMYHFGSMTTRSANILKLSPHGYAELNKKDAQEHGLSEGDVVKIESPTGFIETPIRIVDRFPQGLILVPVHFPQLGVYRLFDENTNVCRVKILKKVSE
ncbi:MAG: molybdopterin dinucleotide binding domain-containing protein, partial [Desulfomonilaceae bacterium]